MDFKKITKEFKEYSLTSSFENSEDLLNCFKSLYLKGYGCYIDLYKFEKTFKIGGTLFYKFKSNEAIKIIKQFNPIYLKVEIKTWSKKKFIIIEKEGLKE